MLTTQNRTIEQILTGGIYTVYDTMSSATLRSRGGSGAGGMLKQRKGESVTRAPSNAHDVRDEAELEEKYGKDCKLTLMDEMMLMGLDPKAGYTSFFNDSISTGLRGAVLIELALRNRIGLKTTNGSRNLSLDRRPVVVLDSAPTGEVVLDEALKNIGSCSETVATWIEYLSGEAWNPLKLKYQLHHVRERLSKGLCEKGILTTAQQNFYVFDVTTHPVIDDKARDEVTLRLQDSLMSKWQSDKNRIDDRDLARIILAHASDVLDQTFSELEDEAYELATEHAQEILDADADYEYRRGDNCNEIVWAVKDFFTEL
ncbi:hypothetical protein SARC_01661 [Sphaeroforma arctica JP610]|uniref:Golgi phosphoprotein 3 n=1 Tax=Sphaeroforma arctica JP610 TaxID=667725 RepID=A0A0L0GD68_9EUKA|nr:hypothetical protein SARC_01661 [Sphaeroforma arctica JP610]KNC86183.1 hypothetical protein SARC_01661 [Sphaeroforma arctica JP610]|eukprot:XP_014160085.1 hypothetical protein SARC_01661 [Sphaeroforma arctica JP610]